MDVVVSKVRDVAAESVGFDGVGTRFEIGAMDLLDDVRAGEVEDLVTALKVVKVVKGEASACSIVPIAPSPMTTRRCMASSSAVFFST